MQTTTQYQPKIGEPCACRPGQQRDNCPQCEGTGQRIDFAKIRARTCIPTEAEYEARERADLMATLRDVESAPLAHRRAARKDWSEAMLATCQHTSTDEVNNVVAERVGWLLNGSYGKGAYDEAWRIVGNTRMNRVAALALLVAALEWRCPEGFARAAARRNLTVEQLKHVNAAIQREIDHAVKEREAGV